MDKDLIKNAISSGSETAVSSAEQTAKEQGTEMKSAEPKTAEVKGAEMKGLGQEGAEVKGAEMKGLGQEGAEAKGAAPKAAGLSLSAQERMMAALKRTEEAAQKANDAINRAKAPDPSTILKTAEKPVEIEAEEPAEIKVEEPATIEAEKPVEIKPEVPAKNEAEEPVETKAEEPAADKAEEKGIMADKLTGTAKAMDMEQAASLDAAKNPDAATAAKAAMQMHPGFRAFKAAQKIRKGENPAPAPAAQAMKNPAAVPDPTVIKDSTVINKPEVIQDAKVVQASKSVQNANAVQDAKEIAQTVQPTEKPTEKPAAKRVEKAAQTAKAVPNPITLQQVQVAAKLLTIEKNKPGSISPHQLQQAVQVLKAAQSIQRSEARQPSQAASVNPQVRTAAQQAQATAQPVQPATQPGQFIDPQQVQASAPQQAANVPVTANTQVPVERINKVKFGLQPVLPYSIEEAINRLRINISFLGNDVKKIMIVSSEPNEGKSFVALNLWKQMAEAQEKSILVDMDMRKSTMAVKYQMSRTDGAELQGTSQFLSSNAPVKDMILQSDMPYGDILPNVDNIVNPSMLLESKKFTELFEYMESNYRYIFVDVPPLGLVSDAELIGSFCDGAVLCVRGGVTSRGIVRRSMQQLERAGCPLLGIVLNRVGASGTGYYNKYYGKKYYGDRYYSRG